MRRSRFRSGSARALAAPLAASLCAGCYPPDGPYDLVGNVGEECGPGSVAEIADDFDDGAKADVWAGYADPSASIAEVNGQVEMQVDGSMRAFAGYLWLGGPRSLLGCHVGVQVKQVGSTTDTVVTYLNVAAEESDDRLNITHTADTLVIGVTEGEASSSQSVPYDPVAHAWWRIRESGGTVSFEASEDGHAWLSLFTAATPAFAGAVGVNVGMGATRPTAGGGFAIVDNLNVVP